MNIRRCDKASFTTPTRAAGVDWKPLSKFNAITFRHFNTQTHLNKQI